MMTSKTVKSDVLIVGAGVAGCGLAIRLARAGLDTAVIDKDKFPRHKLCGEFVSPECIAELESLGVMESIEAIGGDRIRETVFHSLRGRSVTVPSDYFSNGSQGAIGVSRSGMDHQLIKGASNAGAEIFEEMRASDIELDGSNVKRVIAKDAIGDHIRFESQLFVDATGRSRVLGNLVDRKNEKQRKRQQIGHVAFKAHFRDVVLQKGVCEIYFFEGGYGGLSFVEDGAANHCFLIDAGVVRNNGGDPDLLLKNVIFENRKAKEALISADRTMEWMAVAIPGFGKQRTSGIDNLIAVGDSRAFIDPFTGSGMLMALESGQLLASAVERGGLHHVREIRDLYSSEHSKATRKRLLTCRVMRRLAFSPTLSEAVIASIGSSRTLVERIASLTRPVRSH
ncbi:MAG: NAD(P)/FAD-dependent oxidoreductase [Pyrinomonadaceae bacterium]|nr:NAD(P)/FAD-dependent oxidoreductase [Pyrinomonadaceae bacterium]